MFFELYHLESRRIRRGRRGDASPYGHHFGGEVPYKGLVPFRRKPAVHLLARLNLTDAAIGVELPNTRWLPLLCAIRYGACDLGYRVVSDHEIEILQQGETKPWKDFPYAGYPKALPSQPLVFDEEQTYDPNTLNDLLTYAGIFGYAGASPRSYAKLVRHFKNERVAEMFGWESAEAYVEESHTPPFVSGPPIDDCPNSECANHGRAASLRVFALFEEERRKARELWGPNYELQLVYQVCPACAAIRTSNQCT